jgi:dTDP-4-dehydrorhamnose 3,5-epimerase
MARLRVVSMPLEGLAVLERERFEDARGAFARVFCADELREAGMPFAVVQANHSRTAQRGTVRGLHYQHPPHAERKLVHCLRGAVFDVAVDLRRGSRTLLRWHGEVLSAANGRALLIPEGFAHGFQALEDDTELLYLHSRAYVPEAEGGIDPLDPALDIDWPLPPVGLSARDRSHARLESGYAGIEG